MAILSFLDGYLLGYTYACTPIIILSLYHDPSLSLASVTTIYSYILISAMFYHLGRSFISFFGTLIINGNLLISILFSSVSLFLFTASSSSIIALFLTRFLIGMITGYFGYCYETTRGHIRNRISWILAIGVGVAISLSSYGRLFPNWPLLLGAFASTCLFLFLFLLVGFLGKYGIELIDENESLQQPKKRLDLERANIIQIPAVSTQEVQVPVRYLRGCGNDSIEALRRWKLTLSWRKEYEVDNILNEPQPHFALIKQCYPHYIHGRSNLGHPVYYERLGHINICRLKESGVGVQELIRHYVFIAEYLWTVVEPDDDFGQTVSILDVSGVSMGDLMGEALEFLKESTKIIQSHYVERCYKIYVINASYLFTMIWRIVQPLIHENTRKKISILSTDLTELRSLIDISQLPDIYGGTSGALGSSSDEIALNEFVRAINLNETSHLVEGTSTKPAKEIRSGRKKGYVSLVEDYDEESANPNPSDESEEEKSEQNQSWISTLGSTINVLSIFSRSKEEKEAYLGDTNEFYYNQELGKWELRGNATRTSDQKNPIKALPIPLKDPQDDEEQQIIRAIQAAHGYVSESEDDDHDGHNNKSPHHHITRAHLTPTKEFKRSILSKKYEALKVVSMWTYFHWCWRIFLSCTLEIIPLLMLLSPELMGFDLNRLSVGLIFFLSLLLISISQMIHYFNFPNPSSGSLVSAIGISLILQLVSTISLSIFQLVCSTTPSHSTSSSSSNSASMGLLYFILILIVMSYFFTLHITNLFTSTIMVSFRSHLHSPLAKSRASFVDSLGTLVALSLVVLCRDLGVPNSLVLVFPFVITCVIHLLLAIVMLLYPSRRDFFLSEIVW
jgi:hypothetical protein